MIFGMACFFIVLGLVMLSMDMFFPYLTIMQLVETYSTLFPIRLMGLVFIIIGLIVLAVRIVPLNLGMFMDLPSSKVVPLLHSRVRGSDPDAKFLKGKRMDLEIIRAKNKLIKDAGGGFRIGGHSCRRTYETIGFTVPDWVSNFFHVLKTEFGLRNSDEFRELLENLRSLKEPGVSHLSETGDVIKNPSLDEQLRDIKLLKPLMEDYKFRKNFLDLGWKKLKNLDLLLFDGVSHNGEDIELFIDSATPNELDVLEHQTFINEIDRNRRYTDPGEVNWAKYVPWMVFLLLAGVIAAIMLQGAFGS